MIKNIIFSVRKNYKVIMSRRAKLSQLTGILAPKEEPDPVSVQIRTPGTIPVVTFESIWTSSSHTPPYNVVKTRNLLEYLKNNPVKTINSNDQEELIDLLQLCLDKSFPIDDDKLKEKHNVLTMNLNEENSQRLKKLLEIMKYSQSDIQEMIPITILDNLEIQQLEDLHYQGGTQEKIINLADRSIVYQIISLLLILGYNETYRFLSTVASPTDIYFASPLMKRARDKSILDLKILKWKPNVTTGVKCSRCGEKKVIISEQQLRSADEPATLFYACTACNARWKK
jgi:DNA-directed RNA polymerase subunit M/transcription elongation factor TFIIS